MNIDNSLAKVYGGHRYHQYANSLDGVSHSRVEKNHHGRRNDDGSDVKLSDAAKAFTTEKTEVDLKKSLQAGDFLNVQIISQMMKRITGQDLQLTLPSELQNQLDGISVQVPQQPLATPDNQAANSTYQQSASYFEAQITTFSAEGSISTKDGQNVKFSVSLSMSRLFYSQANINASGDGGNNEPLQVSFDGLAAELTTTSFNFSIDYKGSVDQVSTDPKPANGETANPLAGQTVSNNTAATIRHDDAQKPAEQTDDPFGPLFDAVKSIFNALRVWQHHADGSQQLLALGDQSLGAIFLGHITKPLTAEPKTAAVTNVVSNGNFVVPEQAKASTTPQINITA